MSRFAAVFLAAWSCGGCVTDDNYRKTTAQFADCAADDIQISDIITSGKNSWKAICKRDAKIYTCSKEGCAEVE